jgi:DNA polymerase
LKLWLDTETRSPTSLKAAGSVKYAQLAEVIIVTWRVDNGKERCWDCTANPTPPEDLIYALEESDEIWAFNAFFDRTLLDTAANTDWYRALNIPLSKWRCVMAQCFAHGLPGSLDHLCEVFKVPDHLRKLKGGNHIQMFCVPRGDGRYNDRHSHPKEWAEFLEYATRDIPAMVEVHRHAPKWNLPIVNVEWPFDQMVNDRGFAVDVEFAEAAVRATTKEKRKLSDETLSLTNNFVKSTTQRDKLLGYLLIEYGVELPDLKADTIERRLEDPELPEFVKDLLRIRLQASKSSTTKYKRVLNMEVDGRLYGTLQYCAANRTGRWGGRGFQPHNLQRPTHKFDEILVGIDAMKLEVEDLITDNVMALAASCMRSVIVAPPGKKLVVADLSNIEGRKIAWLADEQWKLDAFAAYDRKEGPDLYKVAYARSFGVSPESVEDDSDERQIGKVQELALGYQGGVNAFVTMAVTYNVDLELLAEKAGPTIPKEAIRDAQRVLQWAKKNKRTLGLSDQVYIVCEALKTLWRNAHPKIEALWGAYEHAAFNAIMYPGEEFKAGKCVFDRKKAWLRIRLPSGRYLCYPSPQVDNGKISYMGVNVYNKRWHRISTYGGKIAENITQASSRDILADAMPRAEDEGYSVILTVHDEVNTEVPDSPVFTHKRLSEILSTNPAWAPGLPLSAKGFETKRYKKS